MVKKVVAAVEYLVAAWSKIYSQQLKNLLRFGRKISRGMVEKNSSGGRNISHGGNK